MSPRADTRVWIAPAACALVITAISGVALSRLSWSFVDLYNLFYRATALSWPERPPFPDWAYYPNFAEVTDKIESRTPWWKRPAWWWTRYLGGWPFTAEWLSALFDSNEAPFFQSFVEVRVEPSARRVRVLPWGVHGRLRWRDLDTSPDLRGAGPAPDDQVEWVVPWPN